MVRSALDRPACYHLLSMMRLFAYYLVGLFLGGFLVVQFARAETIPATVIPEVTMWSSLDGSPGYPHSSAEAACASYGNIPVQDRGYGVFRTFNPGVLTGGVCYTTYTDLLTWSNNQQVTSAPVVTALYSQTSAGGGYECPSGGGWTLTGQTCTRPDCSSGQVRNGSGSCVTPTQCGSGQVYNAASNTCVCPAAGSNAMIGGAQAWGIAGDSSACLSGSAFGGCAISCTGGVSASGQASCTGCTFTGQEAPRNPDGSPGSDTARPVGSSPPPTPTVQDLKDQCLAQNKGFIEANGVVTCINATDSPTPVTTTQQQTTTTTTGGTTTSASTSSSTTCQSGNCSNVTTTTDGQGNTTTQTTSAPASTWCQSHSSDPVCQGSNDECKKYPDRAGCKALGDPGEGEAIGAKQIGVSSISVVSMGGAGSCPAPVQLAHGAEFSYESICNALGWLKPLILALAWLAAGGIVMGVFKDG